VTSPQSFVDRVEGLSRTLLEREHIIGTHEEA
jgi:hypothetical protein